MEESKGGEGPPGPAPRGLVRQWAELSPAGRRRMGEFVGNIGLGAAAAIMTLIVIPGAVGKATIDLIGMAAGVIMSVVLAILAVLARLFTEERSGESH